MDFNERLPREAVPINDQDECDDPDCACHQDAAAGRVTARRRSR
ncbi:MAG TPA: hypothetical protein VEH31_14170 [Streptosporangiaceae bacterium]|nr:hypothetical protein [Streptosporangiaceae bacterium]